MIARLGRHIARWLLGLTVTVRDGAQAMITRLESGEADKPEGDGRRTTPATKDGAHPGEAPAHWVRLVKRNAPELLYPGSANVAPRPSSRSFEDDARTDASSGAGFQEPTSTGMPSEAEKAGIPDDPTLWLKLPLPSQNKKDSRNQRMWTESQNQIGDSNGPSKDKVLHFKKETAGNAQASIRANRERVFESRRSQPTSVHTGETAPGPSLSPERKDLSRLARPMDAGRRNAEEMIERASAVHPGASAAGQIEKSSEAEKVRNYKQEDSADASKPFLRISGRHGMPYDRETDGRQQASRIGKGMSAPQSILPETDDESRRRSRESFKALRGSKDSETSPFASQVHKRAANPEQVDERGLSKEQPEGRPPSDGISVDDIRFGSPELRWPNLPGEKIPAETEDPHLTASWPGLAEEQAGATAFSRHRTEAHPEEEMPRTLERLRRLDTEQRGISWNASPF